MGRKRRPRSITRRELLQTSLGTAAAVGLGLPTGLSGALAEEVATPGASASPGAGAVLAAVGPGEVDVALRINGVEQTLAVEPAVTLLDALRERLGLTGTKKGCDRGECGACTLLVNGRRIKSCLTLAVMQEGADITTIEGLAAGRQGGEALHPLQAAFIKHDAFQCGYCTSGQIMSAVALLDEGHAGSDEEIREWMSGNLCRCSAYPNIVAAVREVAHGGSR